MTREEAVRRINQAAEEKLTQLDLSGLDLEELPPEIGKCTQLETLRLGEKFYEEKRELVRNKLTEFPDAVLQLTNLKILNLSHNQITCIPGAIGQLSNLTLVNLSSNQITQIPDAISKLSNLTWLLVSSNQITSIPDAIGQLSHLTLLDLGDNQITSIPDAIGQLSNLTRLYLSYNQITSIPDAIGQLSNLTRLDLDSNQITSIPEALGQLSNLTGLSLRSNQITSIPKALGQLSNLTRLSLRSNQITSIPEALGQLSNLTRLSLSSNQITSIPEVLGQLSNLTRLDLDSNQITSIPEAIGQLSNLTLLDLRFNQIEKIPECLETLPQLKYLDLRHNPLPVSPEVLGSANQNEEPGTPAAIFNYLRQLRSGEVRPLNEAKVLLVGQGSVGKTSLINRLIDNKYNPNEPQTDGLNITDWKITVNTKQVKLNVWDFGGQEIYHATHQFFLTKRSLYLLVCNCRTSEDENRLEYWLKLIESFGDASPVILVGNKCDEQPLDLNRKALRDKYPNIKAILETSCQSGSGIDELRSAIHTEISELKQVY
ncbi:MULTISPECIES: leucine-rich repeat domain-containing protein [unclassified Microcoleus]|uniref:leucine-rich repeat domain-containing protein n=1 Tax=unclassified Microcoleus TaxID=2642155 RepID=UPI002FD231AB